MRMTIELVNQDYHYCLDYVNGKTNIMALNNTNRIIKAVAKGTHENRLKADMVAMLTDIQLEIEELDLKDSVPDYQKGAEESREYIADLLQQKIDALKEQTDGKV